MEDEGWIRWADGQSQVGSIWRDKRKRENNSDSVTPFFPST